MLRPDKRDRKAIMPHRTHRPVLVVEDNDDTREMVEMFLEANGYAVRTATDGLDALERIEHDAPCLILLDVMMPVMDGRAFAYRLHAHPDPKIAQIPIVLLTAVPEARAVQRQIGALDVIEKPVSFDRITKIVERVCGAAE